MKSDSAKKSTPKKSRLPGLSFGNLTINGYLVTTIVVFAFFLGMLTNKVLLLEEEVKKSTSETAQQQAQAPQPVPTEDTTPKKVSVDDDPVLGNKNAKVTLIEFSDYECPFCKRYFDETYEKIKNEYVDTGKIKIVFRDLALSFHDPLATLEAVAANCARVQGDDQTYFNYHDELFKRTTSNGNGLTEADLSTIASELGLDLIQFSTCLADEANKEEVRKDIADAGSVGATGTPTFFVGKSTSNGTILGTKLVGAQPFSAFQQAINAELKK